MNIIIITAVVSVIVTLGVIFLIRFILGVRKSQKQVKDNTEDISSHNHNISEIWNNMDEKYQELYNEMNTRTSDIYAEMNKRDDNLSRELDKRFDRVYQKMEEKKSTTLTKKILFLTGFFYFT